MANPEASAPVVVRADGVHTLDPERAPRAGGDPHRIAPPRALVIDGDRITAVLDDPADAPRGARVIDLRGHWIVPGFTDAHVHFPSWALGLRELRLLDARSVAEAVAMTAAAVQQHPRDGAFLRGRGWRQELWPPTDEEPTRQALDAVTGDVPVALRAHDGHSLWCNSAALARADRPLDVPGGVVERDAAGEPTGILREQSAWEFYDRHAEATHAETLAAVRAALPAAAAAGVVAVHDKDGGRGAPAVFAALSDTGELTLRVWQSIPHDALDKHATEQPPVTPDERFRIGYVKAFMDGTLGSRTAALLDGSGVDILDAPGLAAIIRAAATKGLPVAVHAIGDRANRAALDAFAATQEDWRPRGLRHRVEHAQCIAPEDIDRFAQLGITASVQYTHATSDRDLADRLWSDRLDHAYPYRSLHAAGVRLAGGSDAPVEDLDPLAGLRAAVLRTSDERPAWHPEQALTPAAALESFCVTPAWLSGDEQRRGRLRAGYAADLAVLTHDPLTVDGLREARVAATMLAGEWVFGP